MAAFWPSALAAQSRWTEPAVTFCRLIAAEVAILPVEISLTFRDVVNSTHVPESSASIFLSERCSIAAVLPAARKYGRYGKVMLILSDGAFCWIKCVWLAACWKAADYV